jgi:hypothetical protein
MATGLLLKKLCPARQALAPGHHNIAGSLAIDLGYPSEFLGCPVLHVRLLRQDVCDRSPPFPPGIIRDLAAGDTRSSDGARI